MESLKKAMKFDEDVFGCEYDLDTFNIVATSKFSFGAMENKGLNIFKDKFVLVDPKITTDQGHHQVDLVVGHEYFHNYSGNRVTLANFFNISLKEGLTVNREQMFTAHVTSDAIDRINNVQNLRAGQFSEDDSPLAHAVMTKEAMSVTNLYSHTIYQKGSEVIRMMKTMMGEESFINGVKHYFKKHDGQAVTINEFITCMEETSGLDLSGQFRLWYTQSGRPRVKAEGHYDEVAKTYTLTLSQNTPPTRDQAEKHPQIIPVTMGLVDKDGQSMKLVLSTDTKETKAFGAGERVLLFTEAKQTFVFKNIESEPAFHSLLRGFSAPVDLDPGLSEEQFNAQLINDPDGFNRWDASQKLALHEMKRLYDGFVESGNMPDVNPRYIATIKTILNDTGTDPALVAKSLEAPDIGMVEILVQPVIPAVIASVRRHLKETLAVELKEDFEKLFQRMNDSGPYEYNYAESGKRALKGLALSYLTESGNSVDLERAKGVFFAADNMTDKMLAMDALRDHPSQERADVYQAFFEEFKDDPLTIQKLFVMQSSSNAETTVDDLRDLATKDFFDWKTPDHPVSLMRGLVAGYGQFHRPDGKGYEFIADMAIKMDSINPMIAARVASPLCSWQKYSEDHQKLMVSALKRIADQPKIGVDLREYLIKSLPEEKQEEPRLSMG